MYFGKKVILRAVEESDLPDIMQYINEWKTRRTLGVQLPYSTIAEKNWVDRASKLDPWKDRNLAFVIEDKLTNTFLGTVGLHNIDPQHRNAELGISIWNSTQQGKGYGTDACTVMLWVAFHVLNLQNVYLRYIDFNQRGQKAYEKAGFKQAGKFRKAFFSEGAYHDMHLMDILQDEFLEQYNAGSYTSHEMNN